MSDKGRLVAVLACCITLAAAIVGLAAGRADAQKGKTLTLRESARMKVTKNDEESGETLAAGSGTGTFDSKVHLRVHILDGSKLSARFISKSSRGSLIGAGGARYSVSGSILRFFGTVKIIGGTGAYSDARGHGINVEGVLNRLKERMTMTLDGRISF